MLAYAPLSNEKAERMLGAIKKGIGRFVQDNGKDWEEIVNKIVFGYCCRPMRNGMSPFEFSYGIAPKMFPRNVPRLQNRTESSRGTDFLTVFGVPTARVW